MHVPEDKKARDEQDVQTLGSDVHVRHSELQPKSPYELDSRERKMMRKREAVSL